MAIVTHGGGPGVMAADRAAELGLEIATLHADTVMRLHQALRPGWSGANPVDRLEDAYVERLQIAFDVPA